MPKASLDSKPKPSPSTPTSRHVARGKQTSSPSIRTPMSKPQAMVDYSSYIQPRDSEMTKSSAQAKYKVSLPILYQNCLTVSVPSLGALYLMLSNLLLFKAIRMGEPQSDSSI